MKDKFYKLGIIGNPLAHSVSPAIQAEALSSVKLNGSYEKFEIQKEDIPKLLDYFKNNDFTGFNVTIPYKTEIIKYLDEIDETAEKIGAVNTVKISGNKLIGYNTDIYGFYSSVNNALFVNAALLGCGGAALAVVFALEKMGCKKLTIYARNLDKANEFIQSIQKKVSMHFEARLLENISDLSDVDILINATPLGTKGENQRKTPVKKEIFGTSKKSMIVYDLVYNPSETLFIKNAKEYGLYAINGLDMLILQGAKAFEIWTGEIPDIRTMKAIALKNIG